MKYLESFFKWNKKKKKPNLNYSILLNNLADCLQEIFDKYSISYDKKSDESGYRIHSTEIAWSIKNPGIIPEVPYPYLLISNIPYEGDKSILKDINVNHVLKEDLVVGTLFYNIVNDIQSAQSIIEKRMGTIIDVKFAVTRRSLSIGSILIFPSTSAELKVLDDKHIF